LKADRKKSEFRDGCGRIDAQSETSFLHRFYSKRENGVSSKQPEMDVTARGRVAKCHHAISAPARERASAKLRAARISA
jgi:hypothetical protein